MSVTYVVDGVDYAPGLLQSIASKPKPELAAANATLLRQLLGYPLAVAEQVLAKKGDLPGHPFHGNQYTEVAITDIIPTESKWMDPDVITALANHISHGTLTDPIEVDQIGDKYHVFDGHHRLTAYQQLGITTVPVRVRVKKVE